MFSLVFLRVHGTFFLRSALHLRDISINKGRSFSGVVSKINPTLIVFITYTNISFYTIIFLGMVVILYWYVASVDVLDWSFPFLHYQNALLMRLWKQLIYV